MSAALLTALLLPITAYATYGVDVSAAVSQSTFSCLKSSYGASFAIPRVYRSSGSVDPNGASNINNARAAGIKYVDGYIFPCYSCGNPAKQMDDTINSLAANGVYMLKNDEKHEEIMAKYSNSTEKLLMDANGQHVDLTATAGMLWLDVEGTQYWSSSASSNVNFLQGMVDEGVKKGVHLGFYTSSSQWSPITGDSHQFSKYDLWYPHYDSNPSFSDFKSFGGWTKPAIKQYYGDASQCGVGVDKNFY